MEQKVLETIKQNNLIQNGDKIVLGVSGGPDSMAMLHILKKIKEKNKIKFKIIVAHINHMVRKEASEDEEYVRQNCENMNLEFYSKSIDVKKLANTNKIGVEEAGRKVRYEFFEEVLKKTKANKIAIAHNKNDKVETTLMNILRGSGIKGLRGIEVKNSQYIRPLLECTRKEIEEYCMKNNINPKIDKTNLENDYTRNKVRNIVIPYIEKEFNPNIIETISRLSDLIKKEDKNEIVLKLSKFNNLHEVLRTRIILLAIAKIFGTAKNIEKVHIEDIIKLCENNIGNKYLTPNKNTKVLVKNHKIYISKQK